MVAEDFQDDQPVAVLVSGGLDSAVLVADQLQRTRVQPLYVSVGLAWEREELNMLERLLGAPLFRERTLPLAKLEFTMRDVYSSTHWAIRGTPPAYDTPDEDVYLVGRNVVLLAKGGVYCAQRRITKIALGPLAGNPFPDATPEFFSTFARALSLGLAQNLTILTPFVRMHKAEVISLGQKLGVPFELTMSCNNPSRGMHCGLCSKCRERRDAFDEARITDPTVYANPSPREPRRA
jgi:7-cyano-7-deazaguanine synthase